MYDYGLILKSGFLTSVQLACDQKEKSQLHFPSYGELVFIVSAKQSCVSLLLCGTILIVYQIYVCLGVCFISDVPLIC